ncbi:MAG TPA: DUF3530 family protein [Gammaproteobacteria bacterium]|nr:DUF3530 family protein [Gammaproteobacteria bacterium]
MSPRSLFLALGLCWLPLTGFAADPASAEAEAPAAPAADAASADAAARESAGGEIFVTDREAEYARIAPRLAADDELEWLEAQGRKFVALLRRPRHGPPRGGLLIVPAPQELVDRRELMHGLRSLPPAGGFVTLTFQPPLGAGPAAPASADGAADASAQQAATDEAGKDADTAAQTGAAEKRASPPIHPEFCPRVAAALAALSAALPPPAEGAQAPLLAIAAADASVPAVLGCYADGLPEGLRAFAALGRWSGDFGALAVPSIEFVPLRDRAAVQAADARARLPLAEDAPPRRRVDVDGVDGGLEGAGEDVAKRLRGWLEHLPPAGAAAVPATKGVSS